MRICVLNSSYEESESEFHDHDPFRDPSRWLDPAHTVEHCLVKKATAVRQVQALARRGFDVFLNLCDGSWDEDRAGIEVVQALERLGQPFTGASSLFYDPSRDVMKRAARYAGLATPAFAVITREEEADFVTADLRFPLIVKHPNSYSSIGLTAASRVTTIEALRRESVRMIETYGGALVEEFIEGREFTVLVVENPADAQSPVTFLPVEFLFPPGETFKHFTLKWIDYATARWAPVEDPTLDERLRSAAAKMFAGIVGNGYARCDLRMDAQGELFVLEINPNCAVFYPPEAPSSADVILSLDPEGHAGFLRRILAAAARAAKAWYVDFHREHGYGLRAARDLATGEIIERYEERPHRLVTRAHVDRCFTPQTKRWFAQYAWPLTDEVFVIWSDRPEEWKPINHACDPNAWLDGLDLVARRPIAKGEAITMDYSTFCGPTMEPFDCACGSPACRRVIRGTDGLLPALAERYGDHVSDYVRRMRASRASANDKADGEKIS